MKKIITISSLLIGVVFLAGCGQKPMSQSQSTPPTSVAQEPATNQSATTSAENKVATGSSCGSQVKDASGITYGTVLAEDGKCWLDRNLGATEVATSATDKAAYGWYFQWGRGADGHQISTSDTTLTLSSSDVPGHSKFIINHDNKLDYPIYLNDWHNPQNDNLWQGVKGINNPCPIGFRLPTKEEWSALISAANIKDLSSAFSSVLKISNAGIRNDDSLFYFQGDAAYWSSTPDHGNSPSGGVAYQAAFYSSSAGGDPIASAARGDGLSVRCLKD